MKISTEIQVTIKEGPYSIGAPFTVGGFKISKRTFNSFDSFEKWKKTWGNKNQTYTIKASY